MWFELYCRIIQKVLYIASQLLPWRRPILLEGAGNLEKLPEMIDHEGAAHVMSITDAGIRSLWNSAGHVAVELSVSAGDDTHDGCGGGR